MYFFNPLTDLAWGDLFQTLLPDLVLALTFFTSLAYAVLGRRFGTQRPAVAMSAAVGLALAIGLVWWEEANDLSIRNLGPIAVGFGLIILAGVIYQSIRGSGGSWAGAGLAIGACLMIGWLMGVDWRLDPGVIQTITTVALTVGVLAFLIHRKGTTFPRPAPAAEISEIRREGEDLDEDRQIARRLGRGMRHLKEEATDLFEHPEKADDVMLQLRRMLPAEGWLTERMARLREKAYRFRVGHIAHIEEIQKHIAKLPPTEKRKAASELAASYKELKFDVRIDRLDRAVAANERRIRELTQRAQVLLQQQDHRRLVGVLNEARKLQEHNAKLLRAISRTEERLMAAAQQVAKKAGGVKAA